MPCSTSLPRSRRAVLLGVAAQQRDRVRAQHRLAAAGGEPQTHIGRQPEALDGIGGLVRRRLGEGQVRPDLPRPWREPLQRRQGVQLVVLAVHGADVGIGSELDPIRPTEHRKG
jgi:hypothetical protein